MGVVVPRLAHALSRADDFRQMTLEKLGDLSGIEIMHNGVLVAIYIRPERTKGGILRPDSNIEEDLWQGKTGFVVKTGPNAFVDDETTQFHGQNVQVGDWCCFRVGDTWQFSIREVPCRLVSDAHIKLKLADPSIIF